MEQPDRFELANEVFSDALEQPDAERTSYVKGRCGSDERLCDSVLRLLSRFQGLGDFLDRPARGVLGSRELAPGMLLAGRFRIAELVGRGGMGEVYRAEDTVLGEPAAIKVVRSEWRTDAAILQRLRDEIRLARHISSPHVCRVFDLFTTTLEDGSPITFFSMEYLDGETLSALLSRTGRLEPAAALGIAEGIAEGLDAAHREGIIHRDLKPANIMLVRDRQGRERAVVTDFGLATPVDGAGGSITQTGVLAGTPDYMAPEQFLGDPLTPGADIYSFGLILYEMAAGVRPYRAEGLMRTAMRRLTSDAAPLSQVPGSPRSWDRVLRRALAREPADRYRSAVELVRELRPGTFGLALPFGRAAAGKRSRRWAIAAGGAAALSMSSFFAYRRIRYWKLPEAPLVMLTPIQYAGSTGNGRVAWENARSLDVQIEKGMAQSAHSRLLSREEKHAAWKSIYPESPLPAKFDARDARHIALRKGAQFVMFGELYWLGSKWELSVSFERLGNSTDHAQDVREEHFYADSDRSLLWASAKAIDWIRLVLGESRQEVAARSRVPEEVTTRSWEALREFTEAELNWQARQDGQPWPTDQRVLTENRLRAALDLDPDFALAAARLADIQVASRKLDEGLRSYEKAARLIARRNLTDREALRIRGMFALDSGQYAEAAEVFAQYAAAYPREGLPVFHQARAVECQGHKEAALRLTEEAVRREPGSYVFVMNRAIRLLNAGRRAEAEKECERAAQWNSRDWTDQVRCSLALARYDAPAMWKSLQRMKTEGSAAYRSKAYALEGCLRAEQGDWKNAEGIFRAGLDFDRQYLLPPEFQFGKRKLLARSYLRQGRQGDAIDCCRQALAADEGIRARLEAGAILAQAGDLNGAEACLPPNLPRTPPEGPPRELPAGAEPQLMAWPVYWGRILQLWAEIALAEGKGRIAWELLKQAPPREHIHIWPDTLVRASIASGELNSARAHLEALIANPPAYWLIAEASPAGFMRAALAQAGHAGISPSGITALQRFLNQLNP